MKLGLSLGFTATQGAVGEPHIITATITPTVQAVTDGDTWADLLLASATNTANYASTAGNITTAVAEVNVDGGGWTALAGNEATALSYDESVQVRVTVSDDAGSDPRVWNAGTVSVAGIAPAITASDGLAGRTLTITVDSLTGNPAPSVALTTLTLDAVDVSGDATGSGPWSYVVPDSAAAQTVAWEVTATNSEGNDTASGSEIVAANWAAPSQTAAATLSNLNPRPGAAVTISEGTYTGTPAPTITGTLTLDGVDVTGDMVGLSYAIPAGTHGEALVWSETATNAAGSDGPNTATANIEADAPTFAVPNQSVVSGDGPFTLDLATFVSDDGGDGSITYGLTPKSGVSLAGSVLTFTDSVGTYSGVAVSATNAGGTTNDTFDFEITAAADVTAPVLSAPAASANGSGGATGISVGTDEANGTLYWGIYLSTDTPSVTDIRTGVDAVVNGSQAVSATGTQNVSNQTGLSADTSYQVHFVHRDAAGNDSLAEATAIFTTDGIAPAITGVPTISGSEVEGQVLTATPASVTGTPAPSRTWQWERNGTPIAGATGATYTLQAADVGNTLTVVQTETNDEGADTAESAATGTIAAAATAPAQFGAGDWSVASGDEVATVTIAALPSDGGSAITAIEYQLDGGTWNDSGRTTTGNFTIVGLTNDQAYSVALRAVNAVGNGTASATKSVTPASGGYTISDNIVDIDVAFDDAQSPTQVLITGSDTDYTSQSPYTLTGQDLTDLAAGLPIHICGPFHDESPAGTHNIKPGLYLSPADDQATITQVIKRDGTQIDTLSGEDSYVEVPADDDRTLTYEEVATNLAGSAATQEIELQVAFVPEGFVTDGTSKLASTATLPMATNTKWLIFASYKPVTVGDQVRVILRAGGDDLSSSTAPGIIAYWGGNAFTPGGSIANGDLINILWAWDGVGNHHLKIQVNGSFVNMVSKTHTSGTGPGTNDIFELFDRDNGFPQVNGTVLYRAAIFQPATVPDIDLQATWDNFVQANGSLVAPSVAQAAYGTPDVDIYIGDGIDLAGINAGSHHGTLDSGTLTKSGGNFTAEP